MFTVSVARVARCSHSCAHNPTPSRRVYQQAIRTKPCRQRRHSSSKASTPPDDIPPARSTSDSASSSSSSTTSNSITSTTRTGGRGKKAKLVAANSPARLPMVPTTQHLHPSFINLSSFFSLHRPISVDKRAAIPQSVTEDQFATIFNTKTPQRYQLMDVLQTLQDAVINFEGDEQNQHNPDTLVEVDPHRSKQFSRANIPESIPSAKLFDDLRPFVPPPVPQAAGRRGRRTVREAAVKRAPIRSKQWQTTIVLTEHTLASGHKAYSASGTPLERVPSVAPAAIPAMIIQEQEPVPMTMVELEQPATRGRLRHRIRESTIVEPMMAISVKRQRKLKMKKKKHKKLMKRTRNLRRKLGKI